VRALMAKADAIILDAHLSAINKSAVSVRAKAAQIIRRRYPGFKAAEIKKSMVIVRATRSHPTAKIRVRGRRTPLIAFGAKQTRRGVSVRITTRKIVRGAFIATMKSGHRGVFWRSGEFGRRGNQKLERIEHLTSLSVPQTIEQEVVLDGLRKFALERYRIELVREIKFRTARAGK
jgi:hypothetical protein